MLRRSLLGALFYRARNVKLMVGNYGMQSLEVDAALAAIREIGYEGAELCLMQGWPSEPAKLDSAARRRIREQSLPIPTMIENFTLLGDEAAQRNILDRIARAAELGHDVSPKKTPILQTVLGGKPGEWDQVKERMATRLAEWGQTAAKSKIRLAVKAHIGSACDTPDKLIWLVDKVNNLPIGGIYDFGHFDLLDLPLEGTLRQLLPHSDFITVKDGRMLNGKPSFMLPGEGRIDYKRYFALLKELEYKGWILVEISRQLQTQPGYDGVAAARRSFQFLNALRY
jgi:sugar phosphate isomerase/epimerase